MGRGSVLKQEETRKVMSSVPKNKRNETKFEVEHHFYKLRSAITDLMLIDYGFSVEKYNKIIERYRENHSSANNVEEVVARYQKKCESFCRWFIDRENDTILSLLRKICEEFTTANSIYPSDTPARIAEYCERRLHLDNAIAACQALKQELQYVIVTLPVDNNKYVRLSDMIEKEIAMLKALRKSDNRFAKPNSPNGRKSKKKKTE